MALREEQGRLADPDGPTLRVEETFVRNRVGTPKSEASARTLALGKVVAEALFAHRAATSYDGDDDRVFCHPQTGGPLDHKGFADTFRAALVLAEIDGEVRPFHDGRHASITNAAAAGVAARRPSSSRRSRRPRDDAAVHPPCGRPLPRRSRSRRSAHVRRVGNASDVRREGRGAQIGSTDG